MTPVVHLVQVTIRGPAQLREYRAVCGMPDVRLGYWTINRAEATCPACLSVRGADLRVRIRP